MRSMSQFVCIAVAPILAPSLQTVWAADITIRLIDGKTGRPLMVGTRFQLSGCKGLMPPMKGTVEDCPKEWLSRATTDAEGKATFHLNDPLPPVLSLVLGPVKACTKAQWGHQGTFETQRILNEGIVTRNEICDPKGKLKGKCSPRPGEVVIYCRRFTGWDHFLQEL